MPFEWDQAKQRKTMAIRGLDFGDAPVLFDGRPAVHLPARSEAEERILTVAFVEGKLHTVVWTWRGENRRIISFRRARRGEERAYQAVHG
jgi:uncharacterized protein